MKGNPFRCVHMLNNIYNKLQYSKIIIFCHKFCDITSFLSKISKKRSTIRIMDMFAFNYSERPDQVTFATGFLPNHLNLNRITDL